MEQNKVIKYIGVIALIALIGFKFARRAFGDAIENIAIMPYIFATLFVIFGLYIVVAVREQHDDFVTADKYLMLKKVLGDCGIKVFYYCIGLFFFIIGSIMIIYA